MRVPASVISTRARNGDGRNGSPNGASASNGGAARVLGPLPVDVRQPRVGGRATSDAHAYGALTVAAPAAHAPGPSKPSSVTLRDAELSCAAIADDDRDADALAGDDEPVVGRRIDPQRLRQNDRVLQLLFLQPQPQLDLVLGAVGQPHRAGLRRQIAHRRQRRDEIGHRRRRAAGLERARRRIDARGNRAEGRRRAPAAGAHPRSAPARRATRRSRRRATSPPTAATSESSSRRGGIATTSRLAAPPSARGPGTCACPRRRRRLLQSCNRGSGS